MMLATEQFIKKANKSISLQPQPLQSLLKTKTVDWLSIFIVLCVMTELKYFYNPVGRINVDWLLFCWTPDHFFKVEFFFSLVSQRFMHKNHLVRVPKTSRCDLKYLFWSSDHSLRWSDFLWKIQGFGRHRNGWKYPEVSQTVVGHLAAFPLNAGLSLVLEYFHGVVSTLLLEVETDYFNIMAFPSSFYCLCCKDSWFNFHLPPKSKTVMTIRQYHLCICVLTVSVFSGLTQQQHPSLLLMTQFLRGGGGGGGGGS